MPRVSRGLQKHLVIVLKNKACCFIFDWIALRTGILPSPISALPLTFCSGTSTGLCLRSVYVYIGKRDISPVNKFMFAVAPGIDSLHTAKT